MANFNGQIVFAIDVQQQKDKAIQEAASIANNIMRTHLCIGIFNNQFGTTVEMQEKMNKVLIVFDNYANFDKKTKWEPLSWIDRASETVHIIQINEIFKKRLALDEVCYGGKEWQIIVVAMSIRIVHEVSHLIIRWKGHMHTPPKYIEAGNYIEKGLFQNLICPVIYKINENDDWNETQKFVGKLI